jgi:hypothetical protein
VQRIRHFFNTLQTNWSEDPAARGAAKMTAGAILVAEGLFGVTQQVTRRGRSMGGLLGGFFGLILGLVFMGLGLWMSPSIPEDEIVVEGRIVDVETSRNDEGQSMYSPVYSYVVDGNEYLFTAAVRSSSRPSIGKTVKIGYSESEPLNARSIGGIDGNFHWIFIGSGAFVTLLSFFGLLVSVVLIVFGIILFRGGRADRAAAGVKSGFFSDLMSLAQRSRIGELDIARTAVGQKGPSQGDHAMANEAGDRDGDPKSSSSGPLPGWYFDPDGSEQERWWDGTRWTEHRRSS